MKLLGPSFLPIHDSKFQHHRRFEFSDFFPAQHHTAIYLIENSTNFSLSIILCIKFFNSVVRKPTPHRSKKIMPFPQRSKHIFIPADSNTGYHSQFLHISTEILRILNSHRFIRTPGRKYFHLKPIGLTFQMILQTVHWIIRRTHHLYPVFQHQSPGTVIRSPELQRTLLINLPCRNRIQQLRHSKSSF